MPTSRLGGNSVKGLTFSFKYSNNENRARRQFRGRRGLGLLKEGGAHHTTRSTCQSLRAKRPTNSQVQPASKASTVESAIFPAAPRYLLPGECRGQITPLPLPGLRGGSRRRSIADQDGRESSVIRAHGTMATSRGQSSRGSEEPRTPCMRRGPSSALNELKARRLVERYPS